ncbi:MAG: DinB family protein [Nakamurella sp.]
MAAPGSDGTDRPWPPRAGGEADMLVGFLDYQRATLAWKCGGLTDEQLRVARPPSTITLGGLLKHLASIEDEWFTEVVAGKPTPEPWAGIDQETDPDWAWTSAADDSGEQLRSLWAERVDRARTVVGGLLRNSGVRALDELHSAWLGDVSLRWVMVHMIEEYARHNGQADLIRESIDGQTGE